jgi:eukaryotic-like serine/threonine-protein kinase
MKYLIYVAGCICILLMASSCKKHKAGSEGGNGGPQLSTSKSIISFVFKAADNTGLAADIAGVIATDSIIVFVPYGNSITSLKPTVQHNGISVAPVSGAVQNFSLPVTYVVKAEDGSTKSYIVIVKIKINSTVYAGSDNGKLYAFDGDDGTVKWIYTTGGAINGASPAYYNGTVFIGSADGNLYAVDAATGLLKWKYGSHGSLSNSNLALGNGVLYFGSNPVLQGGPIYLTAINAGNGALIWEKFNISYWSCPTWYYGKLYGGGLYGLGSYNAVDGSSSQGFSASISPGNPLLVNDVLYAGTEGTVVTAYNAATGAVKWHYLDVPGGSPNAGSGGSPTLYNGTIYNSGYTKSIYAIDSASGVLKWKYNAGPNSGYQSSPAVANGIVYSVNTNSYIYAIDAVTGNLRWRFGDDVVIPATSNTANNCTLKGDIVYFGSFGKKFYALNAFTGAVKWQFTTDGIVSGGACVVAQDGTIYYPSISGQQQ